MCPNNCRMVPFLFGSFLLSAFQLSGKEMFAGRMPSDVLYVQTAKRFVMYWQNKMF